MNWVAKPSQYLVVTGLAIKGLKLAKRASVLPGQTCTVLDVSPVNYTFEVQAMSAEKLRFVLPAVFTIGPGVDDEECLYKYARARLLMAHDKLSNLVKELIQVIIEGETRVLAASTTMEEIFRGAKQFKQEVCEKVQQELNLFGLLIYNANVKQLWWMCLVMSISLIWVRTRKWMLQTKQRWTWLRPRKKGEIGAKLREGQTLQNAVKIDAETKIISLESQGEGQKEGIKARTEVQVFENEREAEVAEANSELAKKKAMWEKAAEVVAELQGEVERMNALTRTEKLKAEFLSTASVEYETKVQEANWELYKKQKAAEAILFEKEKEAEAQKTLADAELYAKKKEAEGLVAIGQAKGAYLRTLLDALGGNYAALNFFMINGGMLPEIGNINAEAIQ